MMKLWERNDAPPHVDGAPGAGARPYLVLCRRPPEDADASARDDAPGDTDDTGAAASAPADDDLGHDVDSGGDQHRTATVYQWVRIPR